VTNQNLSNAFPRVRSGAGTPSRTAKSSSTPANIASQRGSPVVEGSA
jgi:hypothetical protein